MVSIDLNADLGEGDRYDEALLDVVTSCNIACGGHAGDAVSMATTVRLAQKKGVAIGAHPAYPDREGFGRRSHFLKGAALRDAITAQLESLATVAALAGERLRHLKPHGALYNDAAKDESLARLVADVAAAHADGLLLVGPPKSALSAAAGDAGIEFRAEGFVDRAYLSDGTLVPRGEVAAVHTDLSTITAQASELAIHGRVTCQDGCVVKLQADTLCIHGDSNQAHEIARAVRDVLTANGVEIRAHA